MALSEIVKILTICLPPTTTKNYVMDPHYFIDEFYVSAGDIEGLELEVSVMPGGKKNVVLTNCKPETTLWVSLVLRQPYP